VNAAGQTSLQKCTPAAKLNPEWCAGPHKNQKVEKTKTNKSLFASFSSEKEESSFFEKKEAKKLLVSDAL
jgi:hypothetical protein